MSQLILCCLALQTNSTTNSTLLSLDAPNFLVNITAVGSIMLGTSMWNSITGIYFNTTFHMQVRGCDML
jgi:hypothetical protein